MLCRFGECYPGIPPDARAFRKTSAARLLRDLLRKCDGAHSKHAAQLFQNADATALLCRTAKDVRPTISCGNYVFAHDPVITTQCIVYKQSHPPQKSCCCSHLEED